MSLWESIKVQHIEFAMEKVKEKDMFLALSTKFRLVYMQMRSWDKKTVMLQFCEY